MKEEEEEEEEREDNEGEEEKEEDEEEAVSSARLEPSTLQWRDNKEWDKVSMTGSAVAEEGEEEEGRRGGAAARAEETKGGSVESMCSSARGQESRTESERELEKRGRESVEGLMDMEKERNIGMKEAKKSKPLEIEVEEEDGMVNSMPAKAAQVFSPSVRIVRSNRPESPAESRQLWMEDSERAAFLGPQETHADGYYDWPREKPKCGCCDVDRDALKVGVSVFTAALIFPLLVWGGYAFLPFDAPLLNSAALRLIYTLRCSVFATVPIILGVFVLGVSRLRFFSVKPLCEGEAEEREVSVHRQYVSDSISLFLLYFLQLGVMATYLSQELLKLVPLLTIIFAFGRLIYWLSVAMGSSVRGVGFGFSFLPTLAMLGANLYFIFMFDAGGSIFAMEDLSTPEPPPAPKQRFWG
ncbi:hypothetical protein AGOR_G00209260 [Albula goreensis]|uniref:Transmembrane protein 79 n=1 Tax=Albula goreensis TaxID=1534307 RepID=A0A8T3CLL0_9TELE|nr:hypothetical protein AGOR_G00209260 [Albula goreensis]